MQSFLCSRFAMLAMLPSLAVAQNPLRVVTGSVERELVGSIARPYPDIDADGIGEYLVGHARGIRIYRGSDGALVRDVQRAQGVVGDVDGDGWLDFWSALHDGPAGAWTSTDVLSGQSGAVLANWPWLETFGPFGTVFGRPIALGDVDGDGRDDFLRVDRVHLSSQVVLASGIDASALRTHAGDVACAPLNDIDGDGVRDYFLAGGGPYGTPPPPRVVSGASGAILASLSLQTPPAGMIVGSIGDVDGDGAADLAYLDFTNFLATGTVVVSSMTGAVLQTFPEFFVASSDIETAHGDFDGDGADDLVLWDPATSELVVRSLASGAIVQRCEVFTFAAAGIGDLDGDGRDELLVGVSHALSSAGKALVLTGNYSERVGTPFGFGDGTSGPCPCATSSKPGVGCANSFGFGARLSAWGSTSLSQRDLFLYESGAWRDSSLLGRSFLLVSASPAAAPQPFDGGLLALNPPIARIAKTRLFSWDAPSLPAWSTWAPAQTVYLQSWYREGNPAGACGTTGNLTNALAITWTP